MCLARSDINERVKVYTRRQILLVLLVTPKRGAEIQKNPRKIPVWGKNNKNFPDIFLSNIIIYVMI